MSSYLKKIIQLLSDEARYSLDKAIELAVSRSHHEVDVEHLLFVLVNNHHEMIESLSLNSGLRGDFLHSALQHTLDSFRSGNTRGPAFSAMLVTFFEAAWLHASVNWQQSKIGNAALLSCLLANDHNVQNALSFNTREALECDLIKAEALLKQIGTECVSDATTKENVVSNENSALAKFTHNLTAQARSGQLDPVLGRESEIRQMIDVLLRRRQNNPVFTGEPGVGKTALIEGLAQRIAFGSVPEALKSCEVLTLDLGLLQAGASVKGEFENRLHTLLKEVKQHPQPIILFIDEAHTLIGAGGNAGQNDAANLLKPALARGEVRVIAATTWTEYKKYFEKDAALARRFQVIKVPEPDEDIATSMLRSVAPIMAHHHNVKIMQSALTAAVKLSSRYIIGRQLPDKSVSLLDTACARVAISQCHQPKEIEDLHVLLNNLHVERQYLLAEGGHQARLCWIEKRERQLRIDLSVMEPEWHLQRQLVTDIQHCEDALQLSTLRERLKSAHQKYALVFESVDDICVADVVAGWTGVPLGRMLEKSHDKIKELPQRLMQRIIGQEHALSCIAEQIRFSQAGINDPLKPTGVFMLAGPSGVGKTETALTLAELMYGGEAGLITINMSEYQEAHSVAALKGAPPGYIGYGQGGVLTEAVRRNPFSVLLLDEVEKAHPDVMELFYQIFDKGWIEDAEGQQVNFRNTLIILTSNLASGKITAACAQAELTPDALCELIRPEFDQVFRPALMGRVQLIPYLPLKVESLKKIIGLKIDKIGERITTSQNDYILKYNLRMISFIAEHCLVTQSGARDIDAVINKLLMPKLADALLENTSNGPQILTLNVSKGKITLTKKSNKEIV